MGQILLFRIENGRAKIDTVNEGRDPDLYRKMLDVFQAARERVWFFWPTEFPGMLNQAFGVNAAYYSRFSCGGVPLPGHEGLDMRATLGTKIMACWDGIVSRVGWHNAYGNHIRLLHEIGENTYESTYAHLDKPAEFEVGDKVFKGQRLGPAGTTGNSSGPHLHLTLKQLGGTKEEGDKSWPCNIIDPTRFFRELQ